MTDDPILAEVRAIRDKLAAECGYDVEEIVRRIRQRQAESGREYVSYPPRRLASREDAAGPGGRRSAGMTMELETITRVPVERLRLDRESPRLAGEAAEASDEWIVARLYRSAVLDELLLSFSANGYLDMEPLVVMAGHDADEGGLIVLEGNRRLATLRLLREPGLVRRIASAENLRISVPAVDDSVRTAFDRVSVYRVASRARARAFMAFKHMKGPAKWDAYRKARFAADWYRAGGADGGALEQIAAAIGDRHDTVRRMVSAIYVLEQAEREGLFDIEDRGTPKFAFSHLVRGALEVTVRRIPEHRVGLGAARTHAESGATREVRRASEAPRVALRIEVGRRAAGRGDAESGHRAARGRAGQRGGAKRPRADAGSR